MQRTGADHTGLDAGHDERSLLRFLLFLGSGMTAAGAAVNEIQDHLIEVAQYNVRATGHVAKLRRDLSV